MHNGNNTYVLKPVSEMCVEDIENINKDMKFLNYFFKEVFFRISRGREDLGVRPSELIEFFSNENGKGGKRINLAVSKFYEKATWYLRNIVLLGSGEFDRVFEKKLAQLKDWKKTWLWFDGYFEQKGLIEPFAKYKKLLVFLDNRREELAFIMGECVKKLKKNGELDLIMEDCKKRLEKL